MWQDNKYLKLDEQVAILLTRLPFGSTPAPAEFCITLEIVFDLANDLLYCDRWDPQNLPSPYATELPPAEQLPSELEYD